MARYGHISVEAQRSAVSHLEASDTTSASFAEESAESGAAPQ
jgi:hypothetical protein